MPIDFHAIPGEPHQSSFTIINTKYLNNSIVCGRGSDVAESLLTGCLGEEQPDERSV